MKNFHRAGAMAALSLLVAGIAGASTLYTPPASCSFTGELLGCRVTNVRKTWPVQVLIEVRDYSGAVLTSDPTMINPGQTDGVDVSGGAYCKFNVTGPKSAVRAAATYFTTMGVVTATVPAKRAVPHRERCIRASAPQRA